MLVKESNTCSLDTMLVTRVCACCVLCSLAVVVCARAPTVPEPRKYDNEYCSQETFSASCGPDEIIMVRSAQYGRMKLGRCVKEDFGFIGCSTDATPALHARCSGRRSCQFPVIQLYGIPHDCSRELAAYLVADYECIKGISCEATQCASSDYLRVPGDSGFIPSAATLSGGCGSVQCPWTIQARPGQRVNLTLLDFGFPAEPHLDTGKMCYRYATLRESAAGVSKELTVCSSDERPTWETPAYVSDGNTLQITIYTASDPDTAAYFALKYQVIGCPLLTPPRNAWVKRLEGGNAEVHCNFTPISYSLRCENTAWVGELGSCVEDPYIGGALGGSQTPAFGMLIIVGVGIFLGVVIGALMLFFTLACLKRRRNQLAARHNPLLGEPGAHGDHIIRYDRDTAGKTSPSFTLRGDSGFYSREHDYTCTLHLKRPLPTPGGEPGMQGAATLHRSVGVAEGDVLPADMDTIKLREHVYETPKFPMQEMALRGLRIHSADGLARKADADEGRSNRTN